MASNKKGSNKSYKGLFAGIIALLLVVVFLAGAIGWGSEGFKNWNVGTWFNSWGRGEQQIDKPDNPDGDKPNTPDNPDDGNSAGTNGAIISGVENKGIKLASALLPRSAYEANGIDPQADTAYVFKAKIEPGDATNKEVDYVVSFANPNSAWASGKTATNYFKVSQATDGALQATGTCYEAFGEQIKITVISRDNPEAKAEVTVDYAKRITDVQVTMKKDGAAVSSLDFSADGNSYTWEYSPIYGIGTKDDSFNYGITLRTANALVDGVRANCSQAINKTGESTSYGWSTTELSFVTSKSNLQSILKYTGGTTGAVGRAQLNDLTNAFLKYSGVVFEMTINVSGTYSSSTFTKTFNTGVSTFAVAVTGVSVGDSIII